MAGGVIPPFLFILCILPALVWPRTIKDANEKKEESRDPSEVWLEHQNLDEMMLGDDPSLGYLSDYVQNQDKCPPPPDGMPPNGCKVKHCKSDSECPGTRYRCCYNGCVFTCMDTLKPPPVIDWIKEPPRRLQSGGSWLVPGPAEQVQGSSKVESCTTTKPDDADALLCPHGYICFIEDPGDPLHGIPNSGHCIPERDPQRPKKKLSQFKLKTDIEHENVCVFNTIIYHSGAKFRYHHHICTCKEGSLLCDVAHVYR